MWHPISYLLSEPRGENKVDKIGSYGSVIFANFSSLHPDHLATIPPSLPPSSGLADWM